MPNRRCLRHFQHDLLTAPTATLDSTINRRKIASLGIPTAWGGYSFEFALSGRMSRMLISELCRKSEDVRVNSEESESVSRERVGDGARKLSQAVVAFARSVAPDYFVT